ncbi:hypothetical protein [Streptomyces sp. NPDC004658]|uniref:hypothetical protein n=1 Tax=Streptomyces sp. NPDC004658 TaxID=3154672 RepID=UPI0033BD0FA5
MSRARVAAGAALLALAALLSTAAAGQHDEARTVRAGDIGWGVVAPTATATPTPEAAPVPASDIGWG